MLRARKDRDRDWPGTDKGPTRLGAMGSFLAVLGLVCSPACNARQDPQAVFDHARQS